MDGESDAAPRADTLDADYAQLSPLLDDVVGQVARLPRCAQERAAVMARLMTRVSIAARKSMIAALHCSDPLDQDRAEYIAAVLTADVEAADEEIRACEALYSAAGRLQ